MKLPFEMTPGRRFAFAFWTGWGFHMGSDLVAKFWIESEWTAVIIVSILTMGLLIVYSKNLANFKMEHTWMMLKAGGPKDEDKWNPPAGATRGSVRPSRPPPPPMPPTKRKKGP